MTDSFELSPFIYNTDHMHTREHIRDVMTGIAIPRGHRLLLVTSGEHATHGQVRNQGIRQQRHTPTAAQICVSQFRDYPR